MFQRLCAMAAASLLCACAAAPAMRPDVSTGPQAEDVLAAVDGFLLAIGNRDPDALREIMLTESTAYAQRGANMPISEIPNSALASPSAGADPFIERYWSPQVSVRGDFAQVWAPYELRDNGERVHCGINALQLVRKSGRWRIAHVLSSMEPDACDALMPASVEHLRPRDGWRETPLQ